MDEKRETFITILERKQAEREKLEELQNKRLKGIAEKLEKGKEGQYLVPSHDSLWEGKGECEGSSKKLKNIQWLTDLEMIERNLNPFTPKVSGSCGECNKTYVWGGEGLVEGIEYKEKAEETIEEARKMRGNKK